MIQKKLKGKREFTISDVNEHVSFETQYIIRMLAGRGHLEKDGTAKLRRYRRKKDAWPPPAEFFAMPQISLPFYVARGFRGYFKQFL